MDEEVHREVLEVVVGVVSEVTLDFLRRRLQEIARDEPTDGAKQVGENGDSHQLFEYGQPCRFGRQLSRWQEANVGQNPRLAGRSNRPVDCRGDDDGRDETRKAGEEGSEHAQRESKPVGLSVAEKADHRMSVDVVADVFEAAVVVCHWRQSNLSDTRSNIRGLGAPY